MKKIYEKIKEFLNLLCSQTQERMIEKNCNSIFISKSELVGIIQKNPNDPNKAADDIISFITKSLRKQIQGE